MNTFVGIGTVSCWVDVEAVSPSNALLNDDGSPVLNDDGSYIYTS